MTFSHILFARPSKPALYQRPSQQRIPPSVAYSHIDENTCPIRMARSLLSSLQHDCPCRRCAQFTSPIEHALHYLDIIDHSVVLLVMHGRCSAKDANLRASWTGITRKGLLGLQQMENSLKEFFAAQSNNEKNGPSRCA